MFYIHRALKETIVMKLTSDDRIVLLFGPRQVGKTTLAKEIMDRLTGGNYLMLSGEDPRTVDVISSCEISRLKGVFSGHAYVVLDEAQYIPNVGTALKIVYDNRVSGEMDPHILVTGSSSLTLAGGTRYPTYGKDTF